MSTTVRPDNLRAALAAKLAAATSQFVELREAEQPHVTPHLNPREIVGTFLLYASGIYPIADTFGRAQAGDLQFDAWYRQWMETLDDVDRAHGSNCATNVRDKNAGKQPALIEREISVSADPSIVVDESAPGARADVRKKLVRFAASPDRAASDLCDEYLRLARRFADDFVRDYARFLP